MSTPKYRTLPQLINNEPVQYYLYIKIAANDRTDALPRSGAVAGGFCRALSAVLCCPHIFLNIYSLSD
jgi:hypothetical protein